MAGEMREKLQEIFDKSMSSASGRIDEYEALFTEAHEEYVKDLREKVKGLLDMGTPYSFRMPEYGKAISAILALLDDHIADVGKKVVARDEPKPYRRYKMITGERFIHAPAGHPNQKPPYFVDVLDARQGEADRRMKRGFSETVFTGTYADGREFHQYYDKGRGYIPDRREDPLIDRRRESP